MQSAHKFTLASGKTVVMREPEIYDLELAAQLAGQKAKENNQIHAQVLIQKETLRLLILEIDGKKLSGTEKEKLFGRGDKTFSLVEYSQALKAVAMLTGGEEAVGNPKMDLIATKSGSGSSSHGASDMPA